jgi:hypothetical protein
MVIHITYAKHPTEDGILHNNVLSLYFKLILKINFYLLNLFSDYMIISNGGTVIIIIVFLDFYLPEDGCISGQNLLEDTL